MTRNTRNKEKVIGREIKRKKNCAYKTPIVPIKLKRCRVEIKRLRLDEPPREIQNLAIKENKKKMSDNVKVVEDLSLQGNLSENWRRFKRDFEIFMIASQFEEEQDKTKIARFLNAVGLEAREVYETFNLTTEQKTKYGEVIQAFASFCEPKKNTTYERYMFNKRNQKEKEPFNEFLMDIRRLVRTCEYQQMESEMLRDKIVMGVWDKKVQTRLLETIELTYEKAVEKCRASEATREQSNKMNTNIEINEVKSNHNPNNWKSNAKTRGNEDNNYAIEKKHRTEQKREFKGNTGYNRRNETNKTDSTNSKCTYCDRIHKPRECPAYGKICRACLKGNHFASVCRTREITTVTTNRMNCEYDNKEFIIGNVEKDESGKVTQWKELIKNSQKKCHI